MPITKMKDEDYPKPKILLRCTKCTSTIESDGIIRDGKPYHQECWDIMLDGIIENEIVKLGQEFPTIDDDYFDEIIEYFYRNMDRVRAALSAQWCLITKYGNDLEVETFKNKTAICEYIAELAPEALIEGIEWFPVAILNKGKGCDSFHFKTILVKDNR